MMISLGGLTVDWGWGLGGGETGSLNLKTAAGTTQGEVQRENRLKAAAVPEGHDEVQTTHEDLEAQSERWER